MSPVRVVLGVAGGIAAYKVCELLRGLTESGHDVRVVPTEAALHFVGAATWEALSGHPVSTQVWSGVADVPHVRLGQDADLVVVAPATADLLARAAHGLADDLLTNVLLTASCPVLMAPAMHTEMWEHPATCANVATLRARGVVVLEPAVGRLTGVDSGKGRLPEASELLAAATALLHRRRDLAGRRVLISAGGTREPLDPVRFLGNRSSGRQGVALAEAALARGAKVVLVAANLVVPAPSAATLVLVGTAAQLHDEMLEQAKHADAVVMAAAVADFRPRRVEATKIKKTGDAPTQVLLERTADVLVDLVARARESADGQLVVGFAAETGDAAGSVVEYGRAKLARKGVDLLVVNDVSGGQGFEVAHNAAVVLGSDGSEVAVPDASKREVADAIWDLVAPRLR
ncbi:MAG: bifunctional phosphopantothenoylcysteine decarboxylase/phosphopantothenate--cysteine ligase CoaBC [Candidatus Nanopelagicales bacterium]